MSDSVRQKEPNPGLSGLRHEIHPPSTDDETCFKQGQSQLHDIDVVMSDKQPQEHADNTGEDHVWMPFHEQEQAILGLADGDRAVLEKCSHQKDKSGTQSAPEVSFVSISLNRAPSPAVSSFQFRTTSVRAGSGTSSAPSATATTGVSSQYLASHPTKDETEQQSQKTSSALRPTSRPGKSGQAEVDPPTSIQSERAPAVPLLGKVGGGTGQDLVGPSESMTKTAGSDKRPGSIQFLATQTGYAPASRSTQNRPNGKKGNKINNGQRVQKRMDPWPPRSPGPNQHVLPEEIFPTTPKRKSAQGPSRQDDQPHFAVEGKHPEGFDPQDGLFTLSQEDSAPKDFGRHEDKAFKKLNCKQDEKFSGDSELVPLSPERMASHRQESSNPFDPSRKGRVSNQRTQSLPSKAKHTRPTRQPKVTRFLDNQEEQLPARLEPLSELDTQSVLSLEFQKCEHPAAQGGPRAPEGPKPEITSSRIKVLGDQHPYPRATSNDRSPTDTSDAPARSPTSNAPEAIVSFQGGQTNHIANNGERTHAATDEGGSRMHCMPASEDPPVKGLDDLAAPSTPQVTCKSPKVHERETSVHGPPSRVTKPPRKPRVQGAGHPLMSRPSGPGPTMSFSDIFEQQLQSIRVSYYSESVRNEHHYGTEIKTRDEKISALQTEKQLADDQIKALQEEVAHTAKLKNQAEKVKGLQKFITGLANDQDKFRATTVAHHKECSAILERKVVEVESEKVALEQSFLIAIEALEKTRRSTKHLLDDFYTKLTVSETRKASLLDQLKAQKSLFEDERKRRSELEQQILASLQSVQRHLEDNNRALHEQLCNVQASVDKVASDEKRDACLQECIDALDDMKKRPILTVKDAQKAEQMLRILHKSVSCKIGALAHSVEENRLPSKELQDYVQEQFGNLRTEILRYEKVNLQLQSLRQTHEHLAGQLKSEKEKGEKLEKRFEELRQSETDFRSKSAQLELELSKVRADRSEPSKLEMEQQMANLRNQLRQAEERLRIATSKLEEEKQLRQGKEKEVAGLMKAADNRDLKTSELKENLRKEVGKDFEEMREKLVTEHQKNVEEQRATFSIDINRLTVERDEKERLLQEVRHELEKTCEAHQQTEQQLRNAKSAVKDLKQEKLDADSKWKDEKSAATLEHANLKEQMRQKTDAFNSQESELGSLQEKHSAMLINSKSLETSISRLKDQLSEYQAKIKTTQEECEARLEEQRKEISADLKDARDQVSSLQNEKRHLQSSLELARSHEKTSLKDAEDRFSTEKERWQIREGEMKTAAEADEKELQRIRREATEESKRVDAGHKDEIADLKRQLEQSLQARKELQAKCKRIENEKDHELNAHKEITDRKMKEKFQEEVQAYRKNINQQMADEVAKIRRQHLESLEGARSEREMTDEEATQPQSYQAFSAMENTLSSDDELPQPQSAQAVSTMKSTLSSLAQLQTHSKPKRKVDRRSSGSNSGTKSRQQGASEHGVSIRQPSPELGIRPRQISESQESIVIPETKIPQTPGLDEQRPTSRANTASRIAHPAVPHFVGQFSQGDTDLNAEAARDYSLAMTPKPALRITYSNKPSTPGSSQQKAASAEHSSHKRKDTAAHADPVSSKRARGPSPRSAIVRGGISSHARSSNAANQGSQGSASQGSKYSASQGSKHSASQGSKHSANQGSQGSANQRKKDTRYNLRFSQELQDE